MAVAGPLAVSLDRLDSTRNALLAQVELLSAEQLRARPAAGGWSVLEVVEHLVIAEREVLEGLPDPDTLVARPRGLKARVLFGMVVLVIGLGIPVKVPSRRMIPKGDRDLEELRRMWDENSAWLRSYVAGLDAAGLERAVFRHPVSGPITTPQAVKLDQAHIERHRGQINRILREVA